jgi:hypothetical protein
MSSTSTATRSTGRAASSAADGARTGVPVR